MDDYFSFKTFFFCIFITQFLASLNSFKWVPLGISGMTSVCACISGSQSSMTCLFFVFNEQNSIYLVTYKK